MAVFFSVACAAQAQTTVPNPDSIEQRVLVCSACHGAQGRATRSGYFPRIAGKPSGYLFNQLLNFREGRRANSQMTYLVQRQGDAYLMEIASYFSGLELPYAMPEPPHASPAVLGRGLSLTRLGDPERGVPACRDCHGETLTGVDPAVPGLLGIPYDYIAAQLGSWREHIRHAQDPDCMSRVADALSPQDIAAVASWLAAQPMPPDPRPAPSFAGPLPLQCGGLPPAQGATR